MNNDTISRSEIINALDKAGALTDYGKYIIENAPTIEARAQWISVEDRLPEESGYYCVAIKDATMSTKLYYGIRDKTWFGNDEEYEVTHWQPLPKPPKMDGEDGEEGEEG